MKRVLTGFVLVLVASMAFATGAAEGETYELIAIDSGAYPWDLADGYFDTQGYDSPQHLVVAEFEQRNPGVKVNYLHRDVTQGSMTVDALMAKGTPPDVWIDAAGYFREYLNPEYSLPLEQYMDVSVFYEDLLAPYTVNGHVYAIPVSNIATGMAINVSMLDEIGYTMPAQEDWTIEEYVRLAGLLKDAGHYVTTVFTQEGFGSWMYPWIYAFGGELYADGDHSRVAINSPESRRALEFLKMLVDEGYAVPYPNEVDDDATVELFTTGRLFSAMMQNGHTDYWIPEQVKNGVIDEVFDYTFVEFPHGPGVAHTPVYGYQTVVNVHRTDDERRNELAAELAGQWLGPQFHSFMTVIAGGFPVIKDFEIPNAGRAAAPSMRAIADVAASAGFMDLGGMHPRAREVMAAATIPIQRYMAGEITAQQFLDIFEADANAILAN